MEEVLKKKASEVDGKRVKKGEIFAGQQEGEGKGCN
jgi:hypothetical protein